MLKYLAEFRRQVCSTCMILGAFFYYAGGFTFRQTICAIGVKKGIGSRIRNLSLACARTPAHPGLIRARAHSSARRPAAFRSSGLLSFVVRL
jgi:hypothetical protein